MAVAAAMTAMPAAAVATAVAAGPLTAAAAAAALALAAALRGRHRLGGAKLQPALAALRAGGTRVIPAFPAAVLGGACRGFAGGALGGYGAVLPVCRILAQASCRCASVILGCCTVGVLFWVFLLFSLFLPQRELKNPIVCSFRIRLFFVRSYKISPPEQPQLEFSVRNLKISWFLRALPARFAPQKAAFFFPFRFSFCAECVIMVPAL